MVGFFIITIKDTKNMMNDLFSLETLHQITLVLTSLVTLASTITAITDTPKDMGLKRKIYKIIEFLALVTEKTKQK